MIQIHRLCVCVSIYPTYTYVLYVYYTNILREFTHIYTCIPCAYRPFRTLYTHIDVFYIHVVYTYPHIYSTCI